MVRLLSLVAHRQRWWWGVVVIIDGGGRIVGGHIDDICGEVDIVITLVVAINAGGVVVEM